MDVYAFYSYSLSERMALLNTSGEYVSCIPFYGFNIHLYVCDRLYIEVYYNRHSHEIAEIEVLDPRDERLHQYAVCVNLLQLHKK